MEPEQVFVEAYWADAWRTYILRWRDPLPSGSLIMTQPASSSVPFVVQLVTDSQFPGFVLIEIERGGNEPSIVKEMESAESEKE